MSDIRISIEQLEEPKRSIGKALLEFYKTMKSLERDEHRGGKQATKIVMTIEDLAKIISPSPEGKTARTAEEVFKEFYHIDQQSELYNEQIEVLQVMELYASQFKSTPIANEEELRDRYYAECTDIKNMLEAQESDVILNVDEMWDWIKENAISMGRKQDAEEIKKKLRYFIYENDLSIEQSIVDGLAEIAYNACLSHAHEPTTIQETAPECSCDKDHVCGLCHKRKGYKVENGKLIQDSKEVAGFKPLFDKILTWVEDDFTKGLFIEEFNKLNNQNR